MKFHTGQTMKYVKKISVWNCLNDLKDDQLLETHTQIPLEVQREVLLNLFARGVESRITLVCLLSVSL